MATTEFPALVGSEKQVAWAAQVRPQVWAEIEAFEARTLDLVAKGEASGRIAPEAAAERREALAFAVEMARGTTDAGRWIAARNRTGGGALLEVVLSGPDRAIRWQGHEAERRAVLGLAGV